MKRVGKPVFFIVAFLIIAFTTLTIFGISTRHGDITTTYVKGANDIRYGIDIRGGVDVTFMPDGYDNATTEQLDAASEVIKQRLVSLNITDYEVYTDKAKNRIIVRFPWKSGESNFDPEAAIKELGDTALLSFREGNNTTSDGKPDGVTKENIILEGKDIKKAKAISYNDEKTGQPTNAVSLELNPEGTQKFSDATKKLAGNGSISIWMDDTMISAPNVNDHISNGTATISGNFTAEEAVSLANKINSGALPFKLKTDNFSTISPTLGLGARDAMVLSGIIAFILICIYIIISYRLPGVIASIALLGQVAGMLAAISGFFPFLESFTLTLPGIAGIILGLGIGVDANIISAERIKEEINNGKSIDGAIDTGFKRGFTAIFDGNITVVIVAVILMGAFGPSDSIFAQMFSWAFSWFGQSIAGSIYSFGYTLLISVLLNFIFGVTCSKLMLKSISKFKAFRKPSLYGGAK